MNCAVASSCLARRMSSLPQLKSEFFFELASLRVHATPLRGKNIEIPKHLRPLSHQQTRGSPLDVLKQSRTANTLTCTLRDVLPEFELDVAELFA